VRSKSKTIQQVKLYDKDGKEILLVENHNGAIVLSMLDDTFSLKRSQRLKEKKPIFVMIDELEEYNDQI